MRAVNTSGSTATPPVRRSSTSTFGTPAPYTAFVVRGLRLPTSQSEISSARSFGVWDLEHPPALRAP